MSIVSQHYFIFLAVLLPLYYFTAEASRWKVLLFASFVFYLFSGTSFYIVFILLTTLSTFFLGKWIGRMAEETDKKLHTEVLEKEEKKRYKKELKKRQRRVLILGLFFNFGILAILKYTNFVIENVNALLYHGGNEQQFSMMNWIFPLGISYYTFQAMGYLIDLYRGKSSAEKSLPRFALFLCFFPQLSFGPISRYSELNRNLFAGHAFDFKNIRFGASRILWGFFKKLVIADRLSIAISLITSDPDTFNGIYILVGMIGFTLQMYADFSGGMDIILGTAELLGIRLPENFNRPFFSKSLAEFWRRWHMTLMQWFRDYIFYPLSGSRFCITGMNFFSSKNLPAIASRFPIYVASISVWFITGLWHGASWKYIAWGLVNCFVILLSQEMTPLYRAFHKHFPKCRGRVYDAFQVIRTFLLFSFIEMFEYYSFANVFRMSFNMLTNFHIQDLYDERFSTLGLSLSDWIVVFLGVLLMLYISLLQRKGSVRERLSKKPEALRFTLYFLLFLSVLLLGIYGQGYDAGSFIYNQF
ncbi:MAG: MBOAT family protein [Oribacterium parvum]|nr:MBOAT family O-acyltransferase [Oribacterium parvum]MBF1269260.1 MBOAT family protein [Oribacterium parvum]